MTRRGGRRPKLAKRKNPAAWCHEVEYVYTLGPEVADIAAETGLIPDDNQQWILDQTFGFDKLGRPAAFEVDLIGPRQNIKTSSIIMMEIGWMYVTEEPFILHTAHELDAAEEAFIDLRERLLDTPILRAELNPAKGDRETPGIYTGNGSWEIHLLNGTRLKYKARGKDSGRALTADKLVLDEGFAVQPSQVGSLYPILTTIPDAQVVVASSAGKLYSSVLRDHRHRGRNGLSPRQFYAEWGDRQPWIGCKSRHCQHAKDAVGCALDDEKRWAEIMPAWGLRVFPETIRNMRQAMVPLEFAREFMVWWEDPPNSDTPGVIDLQQWARLKDATAPAPDQVVLTLAVAPDRSTSTIAAAGAGPNGRTLVVTTTKPGTSWVVPALVGLYGKRNVLGKVGLRANTQDGSLVADMTKAGIGHEPLNSVKAGQACSAFIKGVEERTLVHVGQEELDTAIADATTHYTKSNAEVWDDEVGTPVVAASTAAYQWMTAAKPPPAKPKRAQSTTKTRRGSDIAHAGF